MQKFWAMGAPPPDPQNSPPIANSWLRACSEPGQHSFFRKNVVVVASRSEHYVQIVLPLDQLDDLSTVGSQHNSISFSFFLGLLLFLGITVFRLSWVYRCICCYLRWMVTAKRRNTGFTDWKSAKHKTSFIINKNIAMMSGKIFWSRLYFVAWFGLKFNKIW